MNGHERALSGTPFFYFFCDCRRESLVRTYSGHSVRGEGGLRGITEYVQRESTTFILTHAEYAAYGLQITTGQNEYALHALCFPAHVWDLS